MRGGEPSVLQTPPRPNQGGNPPWTPLFNTRLVKTGTPSALCCSTVARARTGTVLTYDSSYIQYEYRTGTSSSIQCLYRISLYCALFIFKFTYLVRVSIKKIAMDSLIFREIERTGTSWYASEYSVHVSNE